MLIRTTMAGKRMWIGFVWLHRSPALYNGVVYVSVYPGMGPDMRISDYLIGSGAS